MSLQSVEGKIKSEFKNLGHAIASGAKYFDEVAKEAVHVSAKLSSDSSEIDAVVGALAGPQAAAVSDLALHIFGDVAAQLDSVDQAQEAAVAQNGLNLSLDTATIQSVKTAVAQIKGLLAAKGTPAPAK